MNRYRWHCTLGALVYVALMVGFVVVPLPASWYHYLGIGAYIAIGIGIGLLLSATGLTRSDDLPEEDRWPFT